MKHGVQPLLHTSETFIFYLHNETKEMISPTDQWAESQPAVNSKYENSRKTPAVVPPVFQSYAKFFFVWFFLFGCLCAYLGSTKLQDEQYF